jgi:hypothetical protein
MQRFDRLGAAIFRFADHIVAGSCSVIRNKLCGLWRVCRLSESVVK